MTTQVASDYKNSDLSFQIVKATPIVLRSPIKVPVQTSFGVMKDRPAVYLLLEDDKGNTGVGEVWCNFPSCGAEHRARLLETAILPALVGQEFSNPDQCFHSLEQRFRRLSLQTGEFGPLAQSLAGVDIALWDLVSKRLGLPLYQLLGGTNSTIGVYASGINPKGATDTFLRCRDEGYAGFKLKIGFGDDIDYPNIESICSKLASDEVLMVDANQAWTLEQATQQVAKLADYPLQWLEEPMLADEPAENWKVLATQSAIPLAAGENLFSAEGYSQANKESWLSVMQPDMCKWGGFSGVLPVAKEAIAQNKRYCPHFLGGGIGLLASAHVLAAVGGTGILEIDCNPNPLRETLYSPAIVDGQTSLSDQPGLGIDLSSLEALSSNPLFQ